MECNQDRLLQLRQFLQPGVHVHLVGIGGVSMRPLGLVLKGMGLQVTGSDMNASVSTDELIAKGIEVHIGHRAENIRGASCIIRTAAVHNDNPEIAAARAQGIPVFERAMAWGVIMRQYKNSVCISGTHGKTTTTSMVTHVLMQAGVDPTIMIGGYLPLLHAGHRVGCGDTIVLESCEYCDSFLNFAPSIAVIMNIEADHLDYFKDLADVEKSFRQFARLASKRILANGDDANTVKTLAGMDFVPFGLGDGNRITAKNISEDWRHFDVSCDGEIYCHVDLGVFGRHNALDALAAAGVAWLMGLPGDSVTNGLATYHGAGRRMEFKGSYHGADLYDDYAHHPGELRATLDAVASMGYKRTIVAFQPHTYSRTLALFDDFVEQLKKPDVLLLAEIYAAREWNTTGVSSRDLQAKIPGSIYCATLPEVTEKLRELAQPGDIILTVGAGDIYHAGENLLKS
ncbi:MAG: UDP-N-acetylmuramate--L-alanine ligase [Firmicutes bacterium]|nr:UDP-N-acetylmuramate--L-alanine ligase [Bacillota bacterium]